MVTIGISLAIHQSLHASFVPFGSSVASREVEFIELESMHLPFHPLSLPPITLLLSDIRKLVACCNSYQLPPMKGSIVDSIFSAHLLYYGTLIPFN